MQTLQCLVQDRDPRTSHISRSIMEKTIMEMIIADRTISGTLYQIKKWRSFTTPHTLSLLTQVGFQTDNRAHDLIG